MPTAALRSSARAARQPRLDLVGSAAAVAPFQVRVGPYVFQVRLVDKRQMPDRRCAARTDFIRQVFFIRSDQALAPGKLLRGFLFCLFTAMHYSSGLHVDTDAEEAFTHSAATGLVRFALDNPEAWVWFNALLDRVLGHATPQYARLALLQETSLKQMPRVLRMGRRSVRVLLSPRRRTERNGVWGWLDTSRNELVVGRHVIGVQFAVVLLHEIWHLLHNSASLDDGCLFAAYRNMQPHLLMRFVRSNPQAWHWLVRLLNAIRQTQAQRQLAVPRAG